MSWDQSRFRKLLFRLDPETAHHLTLGLLRVAGALAPIRSVLRRTFLVSHASLRVRAFGLDFANPIGLAAGYDKDGIAMHGLACLGFGHLELGAVTPAAQRGNPRPRVFRLVADEALVNRMGFPNRGAGALARRLARGRPKDVVIGVNLGKAADTPLEDAAGDYRLLVGMFFGLADYLVLNLSSPNTPGLRRLQDAPALARLLEEVKQERRQFEAKTGRKVPVLAKLSPDLEARPLQAAVEAIAGAGLEGIVATNTTLNREGLVSPEAAEAGGLSGAPLRGRSTDFLRRVVELSEGSLPVVGVGGVMDSAAAREKLAAGACLVQIYTGLVYRGPGLVRDILTDLAADEKGGSEDSSPPG
ncbi:MAG: quinone-dependent dihydroorotate dehydrogenase [Anaerolineales bacterium]